MLPLFYSANIYNLLIESQEHFLKLAMIPYIYLLDSTTVAARAAFLSPGLFVGLKREVSKIACVISKASNITEKLLAEII